MVIYYLLWFKEKNILSNCCYVSFNAMQKDIKEKFGENGFKKCLFVNEDKTIMFYEQNLNIGEE